MPPAELMVPDPWAPTCSEECGGNGWIACWQCGGGGAFCGCWDDCTPECDQPELACPTPEACRECEGHGGWPCGVCSDADDAG